VIDGPGAQQLRYSLARNELDDGLFVRIVADFGDARGVVGRERMQAVAEERRIRVQRAERAQPRRAIAGLLEQLPGRGVDGRLAVVDEPARNLERDRVRAVPILPDHHDLAGRGYRHDLHPVDRFDAIEIVLAAVLRRAGPDALDTEHAAIRDPLAAQQRPALHAHARLSRTDAAE